MRFVDQEFARRLEHFEAQFGAEYAEALTRLRPDSDAGVEQIAGGG